MVRVLFIHPDLGIGGAERLVVDAAIALQEKGHKINILTNHHDPDHCFTETRDGTLQVDIIGDWIPRNMFGRFYAFCAYIKMLYAAFYTTLVLSRREKIDIIFCDQISIGIPILKLAKNEPKVVFYCHFPDQLLSAKGGFLKQIYRAPLNYFEEQTTGLADCVLVNSKFTRRIFRETFKRLDITPDVLYPSINTKIFKNTKLTGHILELNIPKDSFIFLSINRYERKKNLPLAIEAFYDLGKQLTRPEWDKCYLILAGGYDNRVIENIDHYKELENLADKLNVHSKIRMLRSPSDLQKLYLLKRCHCVIYTPENEHFGIVPLEAMHMSKPIIAANSGGPMETIIHESTGFLCEQNSEEFSKAMLKFVRDTHLCERMGEMGRKTVQQKFSFESFANKLQCIVMEVLCELKKDK